MAGASVVEPLGAIATVWQIAIGLPSVAMALPSGAIAVLSRAIDGKTSWGSG
jgi:hypothetical protein